MLTAVIIPLDRSIEPGSSVPSRWRMRAFRRRVVTTMRRPRPSSLITGASLSSVTVILLLLCFVAWSIGIGVSDVDVVGESCRSKDDAADDVVKELDDDDDDFKLTREDGLVV